MDAPNSDPVMLCSLHSAAVRICLCPKSKELPIYVKGAGARVVSQERIWQVQADGQPIARMAFGDSHDVV